MPTNSNTTRGAGEPLGEENLFAPTPVWARTTTRKRRGFGAASRPAPAPVVTDRPMRTEEARADATADTATVYETRRARGGVNGGAVAAGVVALAAIGGIAWYASQPHDRGMAELTPGATATSQTALNTSAPTAAQLPPAATPAAATETQRTVTTTRASTPASTTTTRRTTTVATRAPAHRARPAASASDEGENASAAAPMMATPQPAPMTSQAPSAATAPMSTPMSVNPAPAAPAAPSAPMSSPAPSGASGTTTSDPASSTTP